MSQETLNISESDENQSPLKRTPEEKSQIITTKINIEEIIKKRKALSLYTRLTKDYIEEDEIENINIIHKEQDRKLKMITLDLLLKKIVKDNFMEDNPILIYSFCQQCYCFMDKEIIFNKVYNCYTFYIKKNVPLTQRENLIKFLNVLVIEMYEYYTKIKLDDPILNLLNNIYQNIIDEICKIVQSNEKEKKIAEEKKTKEINNQQADKEEIKIEDEGNFNINEYQKTLEGNNYEEDQEDDDIEISDNRNSGLLEDINRNRFNQSIRRREEGRVNSCTKFEEIKKSEKERKKKEKEEEKKRKKEEKKKEKGKKKSFLHKLFHNKDKDSNKKEEEEKEDYIKKEKRKLIKSKIDLITPEEELLLCLSSIKNIFAFEAEQRDIDRIKKSINFYNDIKIKMSQIIGKPISDDSNRHALSKSITAENLTKLCLDRKIENDGFFNVIDWEPKYIGEKLIQISKRLIKKVQRRELYKAVFLKKDKEINCPNVMDNIDKFNRLTFFIIENILCYDFAKDRAKIIEKWIDIADYCRKRKDYNDCIAINSALNNYIITGLKKTMNDISTDKNELLKDIKHLCRYKGNYKKLREEIKSLKLNEFYIPYLGTILKDLAFYEENYKYMDGIFINFEKLENVQIAISDFFSFKNTTDRENNYIPEELAFFDKLEDLKESDLEDKANKLEPVFKVDKNKQREKRQTNIDKKYFCDSTVERPNMRDSKRLTKNK